MFDFPTSPANGDQSNGYTWNAASSVWQGGPGIAGPVTEQYFDVGGKTTQDIAVPSWAKSCELEGMHYNQGIYGVAMRYSADGTTFPFGASDYGYHGPLHGTGSSLYQTQATASTTVMYLTYGADNAAAPHHYVANIPLTRSDTAKVLGWMQVQSHALDTAVAQGGRAFWLTGYMSSAAAGSSLSIKAIRVLSQGPTWPAGSWMRVKWYGDSAAIPQTNAIADAPSDGGEYVRVNGVWREKSRSVLLDYGAPGSQAILIPNNVRSMRVTGRIVPATTVLTGLAMYVSFDGGSSFVSSVYQLAGMIQYTGTTTPNPAIQAQVVTPGLSIAPNGDNVSLGCTFNLSIDVIRWATTAHWLGQNHGQNYNSTATINFIQWLTRVLIQSSAHATALSYNAVRFNLSAANITQGSYVNFDWSY